MVKIVDEFSNQHTRGAMQKRKNIKLLVILLVFIAVTVVAYLVTRPEDKVEVNRDIFSYENPSAINKVVFTTDEEKHLLLFERGRWEINNEYKADPQRISVLFAILKQMRVRRKVSKQQQELISGKLKEEGTQIVFYEEDEAVHEFFVWGDEESRMTYVADTPESEAHIVEIPGYRSYLAGIYQLDESGWRDPLVFAMNWANLNSVRVIYPQEPESGFNIKYDKNYYNISEISETDSVKLTDFLDDLSLLYVNDYLNESEQKVHSETIDSEPQASMQVEDVGKKVYTLEIYEALPDNKQIIGRIDSTDYAVFDVSKIRKLMRPRSFFSKK